MVPVDKRRTERRPVSLNAVFKSTQTPSANILLRGHVVNLNHTGLKFHTDEPIAAGACGTVTLLREQTVLGQVEARIVWAAPDNSGDCEAGMVFRNLSPDDEYLVDLQWIHPAR